MRFSILLIIGSLLPAARAGDYTTYIGDEFSCQVTATTMDHAGNTYLTGARTVVPYSPVSGAAALTDAFVTKLDSSGNVVLTVTLSGKGGDQGNGIAVDSSGNIWVVGVTSSPDFPLMNPLQSSLGVFNNVTLGAGFVTKLSPDGGILFSTYLGGTEERSAMTAVALDAGGNAYVTGSTGIPYQIGAVVVAYFAKISSAGDKILYSGNVSATQHACQGGSSCFLSTLMTSGAAIAVDPAGNAYVAGNAYGIGVQATLVGVTLPVTPGALQTNGSGAFVMKVNPSGSGLVYLTMLSAADELGGVPIFASIVEAIAADAAGNAYITGATLDPAFPATSSAFQPALAIPVPPAQISLTDAFAAKLNPSGTAMVWASFLGGTAADQGNSIAVDSSGNVWVSGTTSSTDFPASGGAPQGPEFLVEFNAAGSSLSFGSRFPANTVAASIAIDSSGVSSGVSIGVLHAAGATGIASTVTPSQSAAPRLFGIANSAGGVLSGRFAPGELISIYGENFGVANPAVASFNSAGFLPDSLAGVQVAIGGVPAPLLYASATQINAVVPLAMTSPSSPQVQVTLGNAVLPGFRAAIAPADPQVFLNPDGSAAAMNQDGSINSAAHPAPAGSAVAIWATGTGGFSGVDGQAATTALDTCPCSIQDGVSGEFLSVPFAGTALHLLNGVTQINFKIPSNTGASKRENVLLEVGGETAGGAFVYISQ